MPRQVMAASDGPAPATQITTDANTLQHDEPTEPAAAALNGLTEAQLMEVFKQTSIFNVKSALAHNHALMSAREIDETNDRWSALCGKASRMNRLLLALEQRMPSLAAISFIACVQQAGSHQETPAVQCLGSAKLCGSSASSI